MDPLHHAICLRVVGGRAEAGNRKQGVELCQKRRHELPALIGGHVRGDAEATDPMPEEGSGAGGSSNVHERYGLDTASSPIYHGEEIGVSL